MSNRRRQEAIPVQSSLSTSVGNALDSKTVAAQQLRDGFGAEPRHMIGICTSGILQEAPKSAHEEPWVGRTQKQHAPGEKALADRTKETFWVLKVLNHVERVDDLEPFLKRKPLGIGMNKLISGPVGRIDRSLVMIEPNAVSGASTHDAVQPGRMRDVVSLPGATHVQNGSPIPIGSEELDLLTSCPAGRTFIAQLRSPLVPSIRSVQT